ncbi:MFS transporter [Streptomyces sp. DW26H14]|uniref:MFS transporter n=1 Tax=Streptomyces sp. DW26H14 TaxID=3435395 RepID=UPI00403DE3A1
MASGTPDNTGGGGERKAADTARAGSGTGPAAESAGESAGALRAAGRRAFGWRFVTPLFVGSALNPVNSSIIATALVPIATALHVSVGSTAVLVSALYLASAVAQPTAGKLAEEFGPRRVFLAGILLVMLGGVVGGFGQNLTMLLVARVLIGIGTSAGYPSAMVLIRGRASAAGLGSPPGGVLGGLAIAGMATAAIGPPIGGLLVGWAGWHAAFLINIPLALVALAMTVFWIPRDQGAGSGGPRRGVREIAGRIDLAGIVGFAGMMIALLVFVMALPAVNWIALVLVVVLGVPLVWWELRAGTPFFDLRGLAANGALLRTYLRSALTLLGVYTVMYGLTQWLEAGRGMSTREAGLFLVPMGVMSAVISRPLSRRNLVRGPLLAAAVSMLVASAGILFLSHSSPVVLIVVVSLLFGVVTGTTTVGNQTALYTQSPAAQIGTASGLLRTFGYLGSIASATITGTVFKHSVTDHGLHTVALVLVAAGAVVLVMTVLDRRLRPGRSTGTGTGTGMETGTGAEKQPLEPGDPGGRGSHGSRVGHGDLGGAGEAGGAGGVGGGEGAGRTPGA